MINPDHVVNSNDNSPRRSMYRRNDRHGPRSRLLQYQPLARRLIELFCTEAYKALPDSWEYTFLEYQLCTIYESSLRLGDDRAATVKNLSWVIPANVVLMLNHPDLPL